MTSPIQDFARVDHCVPPLFCPPLVSRPPIRGIRVTDLHTFLPLKGKSDLRTAGRGSRLSRTTRFSLVRERSGGGTNTARSGTALPPLRNRLCAFQTPTVEVTRASAGPGASDRAKAAAAAEKENLRNTSCAELEAVSRMRVARDCCAPPEGKPEALEGSGDSTLAGFASEDKPWMLARARYGVLSGFSESFYFPLHFVFVRAGCDLNGAGGCPPCFKRSHVLGLTP